MILKKTTIGDFAQGVKFKSYDNSFQKRSENSRKNTVNDTVERLQLNIVQRQMYRQLMYGIYEYQGEQLLALTPEAITKIVLNYEKAKRLLHVMKAKKYYEAENKLIDAIIPKAKEISKKDYNWYLPLPKEATLKKLGITTKEIIDKFIEKHLLPKNFYELSEDIIVL